MKLAANLRLVLRSRMLGDACPLAMLKTHTHTQSHIYIYMCVCVCVCVVCVYLRYG